MKSKTKIPSVSTPLRPAVTPTHDQIADHAHQLWLKEGQPSDRELDHWLAAERHLSGPLKDDATRITSEPNDPASSDASEIDDELERMVEPTSRRSTTSLT